jgi:two-component system, OmpR family, sensor kinase
MLEQGHEGSHWQGLFGSIRVRILAAVVVLLAGSSAVSIVLLRDVLLGRLDEEITVSLQREAEEFQLLGQGLDPRTGQPFGDDLRALFDVYFMREVPDEGETLLAFVADRPYRQEAAPSGVESERLTEAIRHWLTLTEPELGTMVTPAGEVAYLAIPRTGVDSDGLFVIVNSPVTERGEIDAAVRTQATIQLLAVVFASLIGLGLAGRVLRPLGSLADTAQTISGTDLTRRIPVRGDDEASRIATAFNDMLGRLERAFATQRQFLDDASHELRAPLTVIRGHVELLELLPEVDDRQSTTAIVIDEIERMNRIIEDLLLLARAERPDFLTMQPVDLAVLTADIHRKAAVLCERDWLLDGVAAATVEADPQRITQAMMQLAENACRHTAAGTAVRIGSSLAGGQVCLWVHDSGAGVPAADAERIFGRFAKGTASQSGRGLGLSIVSAIAEAHGGSARLVPQSGAGARFEIVLPADAARPVGPPARSARG